MERLICSDPEVLCGAPVFAGTRVPIQTLLDYIDDGQTLDAFLDDFPSVSRGLAVSFLHAAKGALVASLN